MKRSILAFGALLLTLSFCTSCNDTPLDANHTYDIEITDGWKTAHGWCHHYKREGNNLKTFAESGELIAEVEVPSDWTIVINRRRWEDK